jgi:aspartate aminotransferase
MKLADRILGIEESPTLAVSAKASAMKAAGIDVIDFSAGEPDFPTPENIKLKGIEAINKKITKYTPAAGIKKLRELVAARYQKQYGHPFSANQVILCNGAKQALFNIIFCLVQQGDEVIIPEPYWVTFPEQVRLAGGTPVYVPTTRESNFAVKPEEVERKITSRTKILLLNSPNNPSGAVIPRETMGALVEICAQRKISILFDECYDCFVFPPFEHSSPLHFFPQARDITFVINTFSKVYSMTGWRLGLALGSADVIAACDKVQGHMTSNPSSISQMAGMEALEGDQSSIGKMYAEYERRRKFIIGALSAMPGVKCNEPQGAFYAFPDISAHLNPEIPDSVAFCQALLEECHVALVPGSGFGREGYVRISYATSMENLQRGCQRILEFLKKRK